MDFLDFVALEGDPQRGRRHHPPARRRNGTGRPHEWTAVRPFPDDFLRHQVVASKGLHDRSGGIRERLLPALAELHILLYALDAPLGPSLFVDDIRCQRGLEALPVGGIEGVDVFTRYLGEVLRGHGVPPFWLVAARYPPRPGLRVPGGGW